MRGGIDLSGDGGLVGGRVEREEESGREAVVVGDAISDVLGVRSKVSAYEPARSMQESLSVSFGVTSSW